MASETSDIPFEAMFTSEQERFIIPVRRYLSFFSELSSWLYWQARIINAILFVIIFLLILTHGYFFR